MKIFHTADWHLGKLVQGVYMTDDQAYVLEQFIEDVRREQPDVIIIAGDLYDRSIPPTEAVELLNHTLETLVLELKVPVLAIAGNHDSPDRIDFAVKLMEKNQLFLCGQMRTPFEPIVLHDAEGEVHFYMVPYADPSIVRHILDNDEIRSHQQAMEAVVDCIKQNWDEDARHVLIGHAFVTAYGEASDNTSDSEKPLSIGGAEHVSAQLFKDFDYVALGHLHQAHHVGLEHVRYSGSPLKYSISEEHHKKGYLSVNLTKQAVEVEKVLLPCKRDMRRIVGTIEEIEKHEPNDDYIYVTLTNENPVIYPMEKIRAVYPNAMHVEREIKRTIGADELTPLTSTMKEQLQPLELFESFYKEVKGVQLSEDKKQWFAEAYEQLIKEGGE